MHFLSYSLLENVFYLVIFKMVLRHFGFCLSVFKLIELYINIPKTVWMVDGWLVFWYYQVEVSQVSERNCGPLCQRSGRFCPTITFACLFEYIDFGLFFLDLL